MNVDWILQMLQPKGCCHQQGTIGNKLLPRYEKMDISHCTASNSKVRKENNYNNMN